jgi:hypothetical protein
MHLQPQNYAFTLRALLELLVVDGGLLTGGTVGGL